MSPTPWHALTRCDSPGGPRVAIVTGDPDHPRLHWLDSAAQAFGLSAQAARLAREGVDALVADAGEAACLARLASALVDSPASALAARCDGARVLAPCAPSRLFAAASNYHEHAREMGTQLAERSELQPYFFIKADSAVVGPGDPVVLPPGSTRVDWEVELAAIVGRGGRHVPVDDALSHVAGYTIINDVSERDLNRRSDYPFKHDWFRGKSWDSFAPLGPWVVPAACIPDPQDLRLQLWINDEPMQDDRTGAMIFSLAEQIAYLSSILTLRPGDLIATGTPTGVGMGRGVYLKAGDRMRLAIERIGTLENPVVATEPRSANA